MTWDYVAEDSKLGGKRTSLITTAAKDLASARMIAFDDLLGTFVITDLGRIAAKYYIRYKSIEIFNKELKSKMTEADALALLCMSTEVRRVLHHPLPFSYRRISSSIKSKIVTARRTS